MKKLLIFDLDGTLAHTRPILNFVFADALTECGFPETAEHIGALVAESGYLPTPDGAHAPTAYFNSIPDDFGLYFWTHYDKYYLSAADRLYEGIRETIAELKTRGHSIALFSNKPHRFTERIINKAFSKGYFDFILGGTPEIAPKPSPSGIKYICKMLGFDPADTYMIGDLPADATAAKDAAANFIGVLWGYSTLEQLTECGATVFAASPSDILTII